MLMHESWLVTPEARRADEGAAFTLEDDAAWRSLRYPALVPPGRSLKTRGLFRRDGIRVDAGPSKLTATELAEVGQALRWSREDARSAMPRSDQAYKGRGGVGCRFLSVCRSAMPTYTCLAEPLLTGNPF